MKQSQQELNAILTRYRGFHDAEYREFELVPPIGPNTKFTCRISLLAQDFGDRTWKFVTLSISGVSEFQIRYNDQQDYPNIRDDVAITIFGDLVGVDLGFSTANPKSLDDIRQSDIYFLGHDIAIDERVVSAIPSINNNARPVGLQDHTDSCDTG